MSERALPLGRSSWRALPAIALAALLPKCPVCLFGLLAAVGATGIQSTLAAYLDARVIFASTIMALACATAWLAASRGVIGGAVAAIAALLIVCGKHVFFSPALVVAGVATLVIYLGFGPVVSAFHRE